MKDTLGIYTLEDLYKRIKPALYSKKKELNRIGIDYIKEIDIWNYLSQNDWKKEKNLNLSKMVSDIFNLEAYKIKNYAKDLLKKEDRYLKTEEDLL